MKKNIVIVICMLIAVLFFIIFTDLVSNKTFFKEKYTTQNGKEIFIPKYSYFIKESGLTVASFYSLRSKESLQKEIDEHMKDFEYFENEYTYGHKKDNLNIQLYEVKDEKLYRKIYICYDYIY